MDGRPAKPGDYWLSVVGERGAKSFASHFTRSAVLEASVLWAPLVGVQKIGMFVDESHNILDRLTFVSETNDGPLTFMEWEGRAFGTDVGGATILTRDPSGRIKRVQVYHRPLHLLVRFSTELGRRLEEKMDRLHFGGS